MRRPDRTLATVDHNVPTIGREAGIADPLSAAQVEALERNCAEFGIPLFSLRSPRQGIVHVVGPELGVTQPGMTIVCGDSHTSTHGAFGALAFGIGTSEVEHVLATQTLPQSTPRTMRVSIEGEPGVGVGAKDLILGTIGALGVAGARGHVVEYAGSAIRALSMEGRMTVCNMSIEWGARAGMVAPDDTTFAWFAGRPGAPEDLDAAVESWRALAGRRGRRLRPRGGRGRRRPRPPGHLGHPPGHGRAGHRPRAHAGRRRARGRRGRRSGPSSTWACTAARPIEDIAIDAVFIGSCTNGRLPDLRAAAEVVRGRRVAAGVRAMVVPGSMQVKAEAEAEGLDEVFRAAGFEWRDAGCSMCLAMNDDVLAEGERCASTSNRNFEGRQGKGGRTHLVSPPMAAAAAIAGHLVDVRSFDAEPAGVA